jgi:hypothetical protein
MPIYKVTVRKTVALTKGVFKETKFTIETTSAAQLREAIEEIIGNDEPEGGAPSA